MNLKYIREHQVEWNAAFNEIDNFLIRWLPAHCVVHHVGSTAIPSMPAKDIIDVNIECPLGTLPEVIDCLDRAGYDHVGDRGIRTREAFSLRQRVQAQALPSHHLYACEASSPELHRHLSLRDFLREHTNRRDWLANEKRHADYSAQTRDQYIEGKSDAYQKILKEALQWRAQSQLAGECE